MGIRLSAGSTRSTGSSTRHPLSPPLFFSVLVLVDNISPSQHQPQPQSLPDSATEHVGTLEAKQKKEFDAELETEACHAMFHKACAKTMLALRDLRAAGGEPNP